MKKAERKITVMKILNFLYDLYILLYLILNTWLKFEIHQLTPLKHIYSFLLIIQIFFSWKSLLKVGCVSNSKYYNDISPMIYTFIIVENFTRFTKI